MPGSERKKMKWKAPFRATAGYSTVYLSHLAGEAANRPVVHVLGSRLTTDSTFLGSWYHRIVLLLLDHGRVVRCARAAEESSETGPLLLFFSRLNDTTCYTYYISHTSKSSMSSLSKAAYK